MYDQDGNLWMAYGSYGNGIYILRLDKNTGKPQEKGFGKQIACRPLHMVRAIEGSYISYNPEFKKYYLFVSYGATSNPFTYNVRVARSNSIDSPYVDSNGIEMNKTTIYECTVLPSWD